MSETEHKSVKSTSNSKKGKRVKMNTADKISVGKWIGAISLTILIYVSTFVAFKTSIERDVKELQLHSDEQKRELKITQNSMNEQFRCIQSGMEVIRLDHMKTLQDITANINLKLTKIEVDVAGIRTHLSLISPPISFLEEIDEFPKL